MGWWFSRLLGLLAVIVSRVIVTFIVVAHHGSGSRATTSSDDWRLEIGDWRGMAMIFACAGVVDCGDRLGVDEGCLPAVSISDPRHQPPELNRGL